MLTLIFWLFVIIGIIFVISMLPALFDSAKQALENVLNLIFYSKVLLIICVVGGGYLAADVGIGAGALLYLYIVSKLIRYSGRKEVENKLQELLSGNGIVAKSSAESIVPALTPSTVIYSKFHDKEAAVKFLSKEVQSGNIVFGTLTDGREYYYISKAYNIFAQAMLDKLNDKIPAYFKKYGVMSKDDLHNIVLNMQDISENALKNTNNDDKYYFYKQFEVNESLVNGHSEKLYDKYVKDNLIDNKNLESIDYYGEGKLFFEPNILQNKWEVIKKDANYKVINKEKIERYFGSHRIDRQKAIIQFVSQNDGLKYDYNSKLHSFIERQYAAEHLCSRCNKLYNTLKRYGPDKYCLSCLNDLREENDINEADGKTVKRYIAAPPPGVEEQLMAMDNNMH
ncbi:hypothetical protein, partial [Anaerovibrio lipolyticus]|uniref:hypothetical protein n=1 Tax=Anaerovibrio lipolyticus TaxID=82374 RepID=UPI00126A277B